MDILMIEDNPGDSRLIQVVLNDTMDVPYELVTATTCAEAVGALEARTFDVILMDLNLPDSNGTDTFHTIQSQAIEVPIVVLTSMGQETIGLELVQAGAQDFINKGSFDGNLLVRSLRYAIERNRLDRALDEAHWRRSLYLDILSHDITGLNQGILIHLEQLSSSPDLADGPRQKITQALEQAWFISNLVSQIELQSCLDDVEMVTEVVDLVPCIELASKAIMRMYPARHLDIPVDVPEDGAFTTGNHLLINVIVNLLSNAIKHTEAIDVVVSVRCSPSDDGTEWQIEVDDHGPGVPPEERDVLFERTFRGKGRARGSGLGLFIVKEVVARSGGNVHVEDRVPGNWREGSRFIVRLPLVKHKPAAPLDHDALVKLLNVPPPIEVPIIEVGRRPG